MNMPIIGGHYTNYLVTGRQAVWEVGETQLGMSKDTTIAFYSTHYQIQL